MILIQIAIVAVLAVLAAILGGFECLFVFFAPPSLILALMPVIGYTAYRGHKHFVTGIKAVIHAPDQRNDEVSAYFRYLALTSMVAAVFVTICCLTLSFSVMTGNAEGGGLLVSIALLTLFYTVGLVVTVYLPIVHQFAEEIVSCPKHQSLLVAESLLAICSFVLILSAVTVMLVQAGALKMSIADAARGYINNWGISPNLYWNVPSFLLIIFTLAAFRIGAGKLKNRFDWVPVCMFAGSFWAMEGLALMLANLDTERYFSGTQVVTLPMLYAGLLAIAVMIDRPWFFSRIALNWVILVTGFACYTVYVDYTKYDAPLAFLDYNEIATAPLCMALIFDAVHRYLLWKETPRTLRISKQTPAM